MSGTVAIEAELNGIVKEVGLGYLVLLNETFVKI